VRVALVCPYSWSVPGGVQTHVAGLARELRARGFEAEILAPVDGPVDLTGFVPLGRSIGLPDNGSVTRITLTPASVARTVRLVRRRRFDLVHLHEPMLPAACLTALHAADGPVVGTFHMLNVSDRWYRLFGPFVRRSARRLAARIAVSAAARDFAARFLPGEFRVIPNGVDVGAYARANGSRDGRRVVFVGRADVRKGLPVLLRAFAQLPAEAALDLVGVTPHELTRLAGAIPAEARVRVAAHGRVSDEERRRLLMRADVLCAPSLGGESFGVVLAEGMAAGLPVVASDIAGYREVLPVSCGRLVPPGDVGNLAAALASLLRDPGERRRLGDAGRVEAARFDWSRVTDRVVEVYREALAEGRR
jgi:phosphatidylinositol alpha-mannosyltransferase